MPQIDRRSGVYQQAAIKLPCRVVAISNIVLDGLQTIDGVVLVADDRVLVTGQTDTTENGIYAADTGEWERTADFDGPRDVVQGTMIAVTAGTAYEESVWRVTTASPSPGSAMVLERMDAGALASASAFIQTLLDDVDAATARTTLGAVGLTGNETVAGTKTFSGTINFDGPVDFDDTEDHSGTETHTGTASFTNLRGTVIPEGRLTLTTAVPVLVANVAAAATVYYTPYSGDVIPIYDGTGFLLKTFAELSNVLANSATGSAGPAAAIADRNYDMFVWNDAGTLRLTRGGAWNSATARSATTENDLVRVKGLRLNLNDITNGPAASRGTYVGTIRTDSGGATVTWHTGGLAANGTAATLGVWNAYNRRPVYGLVGDSTTSWNYTTATIRPANNSSTMRVSFVQGLQEEFFVASYAINSANTGGAGSGNGIGLNSTTAFSGRIGAISSVNTAAFPIGIGIHRAQLLGFNYMQALEKGPAAGTTTWHSTGLSGGTDQNSGLEYEGLF